MQYVAYFSAHEQTSPLSDQIGRNEYETDLTDSKLEYNKADEDYSEDEVNEYFIENINARVYVEQVDTTGEAQSIIRQHSTGTSFGIFLPFECFQFSMFCIALFPVI